MRDHSSGDDGGDDGGGDGGHDSDGSGGDNGGCGDDGGCVDNGGDNVCQDDNSQYLIIALPCVLTMEFSPGYS